MKPRADGRYPATKRVNGKKVYAYGSSPEEARENLKALVDATLLTIEEPQDAAPAIYTVHDAAGFLWLPFEEGRVRAGQIEKETLDRYRTHYKDRIRSGIGARPIAALTWLDIQNEVNNWSAEFSPSEVNNSLSILRAICRLYQRSGHAPEGWTSPVVDVDTPRLKKPRKRKMSVDQAVKLLKDIEGTELSAPAYIAIMAGLRESEICGLPWDNLDREACTLVIDRQYVEPKNKKAPYVKMYTKGKEGLEGEREGRVIHLPRVVIDEIYRRGDKEFKTIVSFTRKRRAGRFKAGKDMMLPGRLYKLWEENRDRLGYSGWSFHDLRHAAASVMIDAGIHPLVAMENLGHRELKETLGYSAAPDTAKKVSAERLALAVKNANDRLL